MLTNAQAMDMQCADDAHVHGCPCHAGGDPIYRCGICGRDTSDGLYINVSKADGSVERVCDICYEKGDEGPDIGLDYTEDEPEGWREGQPEFNGAFG